MATGAVRRRSASKRGEVAVSRCFCYLSIDLFHIQKPGSYITPCPQYLSTRIDGLLYSLWLLPILTGCTMTPLGKTVHLTSASASLPQKMYCPGPLPTLAACRLDLDMVSAAPVPFSPGVPFFFIVRLATLGGWACRGCRRPPRNFCMSKSSLVEGVAVPCLPAASILPPARARLVHLRHGDSGRRAGPPRRRLVQLPRDKRQTVMSGTLGFGVWTL